MPGEFDSWEPRRIGIIGAGAMGTSLAAALGRIVPVVVVCRNPARAAAIFRYGVRACGAIEAAAAPIVVRAAADLAEIGGVSALFVTTKTTSIAALAAELRPLMPRLGDQPGAPFLVSYQNGIEPGRQLIEMVGDRRVLRMVLNVGVALRGESGEAEVTLSYPPHAIGCLDAAHRRPCEKIAALLTRAGLETVFDDQIERRVWLKGVINAAINPVAALVNSTVGQVLDSPARGIVDRLLAEGLAVAAAEGFDLVADSSAAMRSVAERGREHMPSMVEDIRAGRESEVGQLNRQIIEHGRRVGVPVPTHETIDALIETFDWKIYAARPPGGAGAAAFGPGAGWRGTP